MMKVINLDHISAKPLLPEVKAVMIAAIEKDYHNPSSQHKSGEEAAAALQAARESVASLLNCSTPQEPPAGPTRSIMPSKAWPWPTKTRASISLRPISSTMP